MLSSGTMLMMRGSISLYASHWVKASKKPGPSLLYIAVIFSLTAGHAETAAYTAKLPPLEWPPTRMGISKSAKCASIYAAARRWPSVSGR